MIFNLSRGSKTIYMKTQQPQDDSAFFRNTLIVIGIIVVIGSVTAWRLGSSGNVGSDADDQQAQASIDQPDASGAYPITVSSSGYSPTEVVVKQGERVKLKLTTNKTYGCARAFTIPKLGIVRNLEATGTDTVEFVAEEKGQFVFQCSMGMFQGVIRVI